MKEKELERVFKAFANRRRIAILRHLKGRKEASVGEIAEEIRLSFTATSKHLGILSAAGIVDREQQSLLMLYHLADDTPEAARRVLAIL